MNEAELIPVEYKVLVKLVEIENKTAGGIIIPDDRHERDQMAVTEAELIRCGGNAFEDWKDPKPKPGDKVLVNKYAGDKPHKGETPYRLCNDKEIVGIIPA